MIDQNNFIDFREESEINDGERIAVSQINLHKCSAANLQHNWWMLDGKGNDIRIGIVQEPHIYNNKVTDYSSELNIFQYTGKDKVRAAIITTNNIDAWQILQFTNADQSVIGFKSGDKTFVLASVYMPFDSKEAPPPNSMKELRQFCDVNNFYLTISSDCNSHHALWGCEYNNKRGESLVDYILSNDLHVINTGSKPTFQVKNRSQILDITLASTNMLDHIENWNVTDRITVSDHKQIEYELLTEVKIKMREYRNIKKTDWSRYVTDLEEKLSDVDLDNVDIQIGAKMVEQAIISSYHDNCKLRKEKVRKPEAPWWNNELRDLERNTKRLKRRYEREPTDERGREFKQTLNRFTNEKRKAKRKAWRDFCSEMTDLSTTAKIAKVMTQGKIKKIGTLRKLDGSYTTSPSETLQVLLDTHFPDKVRTEANNLDIFVGNNNNSKAIYDNINEESVKSAILSFKPYKSPGQDGIFPVLLQKGIDVLLPHLVKLYRKSIEVGTIPESWLETRVSFIPKPGKSDYTDPKSYRPISLSSFVLKGLEKVILYHVNEEHINKDNFFSKNLYSYREGINTEDALHNLISKIEKAILNGEYAVVLFLDIESAFNTADINSIIKNLSEHGIDNLTVRWIKYMLENRQVIVSMFDDILKKLADRGAPQGGVLSGGLIWNIIMNDLLRRYPKRHPAEDNIFADDDAKVVVGKCLSTILNIIQQDIKILEEWATDHGLRFAPSKTKLMLFTNKTVKNKGTVKMQGVEIEWVNTFKYLGVTLDTRLNWTKQVSNAAKKAVITYAQTRRMMGNRWGLTPQVCRWTYISIVRPIMTYACSVWAGAMEVKSQVKKLERVQRKALITTMNGMSSTPTASLNIMTDILPIQVYIKRTAVASYIRLKENGNWKPRVGEPLKFRSHSQVIQNIVKNIPEVTMPRDKLKNKCMVNKKFEVSIKSRNEWKDVMIRPTPLEEGIINCFTDGSKDDKSSGCAYIVRGKDLTSKGFRNLGKHTSVFQAEITALLDLAEDLSRRNIEGNVINVYIDSQAAIKTLSKYLITQKTVLECKKALNILGGNNRLTLHWIPSHTGHLGNEIADRLAKLGTDNNNYGNTREKPLPPISTSVGKYALNQWAENEHQVIWKRLPKLRQSKMMMPKVTPNIWKELRKYSRVEIKVFCYLLTGHAKLKRHMTLMEIENSPMCDCGEGDEETVYHFLGECPAFNTIRYNIFGYHYLGTDQMSSLSLEHIMKFVRKTGKFDEIVQ